MVIRIRQWLEAHGAEAAIFLILFAVCLPSLGSADFGWHLRTGQLIYETHAIPRSDPFSYTFAGQRWITHEWLSEWLLYAAYRFGGYAAVIAIFGLIGAAAYWLAFYCVEGPLYVRIPVLALAVWAAHPTFLVRPQVFTLFLFSLFCLLLETHRRTSNWRLLVALPFLTTLWVNLHGGYIIGPAVIGLFLAGYVLDALADASARQKLGARAAQLGAALLACLAVVPLNPNGLRLYTYPFETLTSTAQQTLLTEWQPPSPTQFLFFPFFLLVGLTILSLPLRRKTLRPGEVLFVTFFAVAALHSMRHMALFSIACIPLLSGWRLAPLPWRFPKPLRYAAFVTLVLLSGWRWRASMAGAATFERTRFPADAVTFLKGSHPAGQIFNAYAFGGYLVWRLYPEYRVYMDGRADLYGDAFLARFNELYQGEADPQPEFLRRDIRTVLVEPGSPIDRLLSFTRGWRKVYQDSVAIIYMRSDALSSD
ncbi:MAG TPA: hypothetical protein VHS29_01920 [Candidatus Acidoferrales bacterium]|jgi:hypothetical protein|nr:hypothetical protein [Candidatus Acidoferrales bacterium]